MYPVVLDAGSLWGLFLMPDKHVGRTRIYEKIRFRVYRKPFGAPKSKFELMAIVGPYFIKNRSEIPGICRAIAKANVEMGMYDWGFKHEVMDLSAHHTTVEDSDWQTKENFKKLGHA